MFKSEICKKLEEFLTPVLDRINYELVYIEYLKSRKDWILRLYIDKPGGITLKDCEKVSKLVDEKLDELNLIETHYLLEVCSPGLDRPLIKDRDFVRFQGKKIKVKTLEAIDNRKNFTGILKSFKDGVLHLELIDKEEVFIIEKVKIKKANLIIEI